MCLTRKAQCHWGNVEDRQPGWTISATSPCQDDTIPTPHVPASTSLVVCLDYAKSTIRLSKADFNLSQEALQSYNPFSRPRGLESWAVIVAEF